MNAPLALLTARSAYHETVHPTQARPHATDEHPTRPIRRHARTTPPRTPPSRRVLASAKGTHPASRMRRARLAHCVVLKRRARLANTSGTHTTCESPRMHHGMQTMRSPFLRAHFAGTAGWAADHCNAWQELGRSAAADLESALARRDRHGTHLPDHSPLAPTADTSRPPVPLAGVRTLLRTQARRISPCAHGGERPQSSGERPGRNGLTRYFVQSDTAQSQRGARHTPARCVPAGAHGGEARDAGHYKVSRLSVLVYIPGRDELTCCFIRSDTARSRRGARSRQAGLGGAAVE